ncbi:flagellar biosynthesis protein FlhB [Ideonella sp. A 288]|uniref:flagellar biosynthesis protein FlhB n=1 Tax=Ideonella sp. A 288 TaxID=1962181 RepID=UPI000B4AB82C|nr:flagellar biosynthesis protein FlhB [Ideonella sp. A 288]
MADAQDRNLPASERKLRKAREDGQVARSRDLAHLGVVGGGGAVLLAAMPWLLDATQDILRAGLRFDAHDLQGAEGMLQRLGDLVMAFLGIVVPMGAVVTLLAVGAGVLSGGWNFTFKPLAPKFSHLDPLAGLGRMVSRDHLGNLVKSCVLALVVGAIGATYLASHLQDFHDALTMSLPVALAHTGQALIGGLGLMALALGVSAMIDVPLQRAMHARRLKMSVQEVKQEQKDSEGNVEVKAKLRARMREMAQRRMMAAVPGADLVVMNPTHYAVALKYEDGKMAAPKVVAKGADLIALRIRDIAREAKVPVLQAPALARALYAHTELDQEVPARLFAAVAQVLAYVYQLRAALDGRGAWPNALPELDVPPDMDPHLKHEGAGA